MAEENYILDEKILDLVFAYMFETRGTYQDAGKIARDIEEKHKTKYRYNDVLMCLDQLVLDGFAFQEPEKWDVSPVYRLTYQGYLTFRKSEGKEYQIRIKRKSWKRTTNVFKNTVIAMNAIAILIITGSQVYFDQKDSQLENQLWSMEQRIEQLTRENIDLRLKLEKTTTHNSTYKTNAGAVLNSKSDTIN